MTQNLKRPGANQRELNPITNRSAYFLQLQNDTSNWADAEKFIGWEDGEADAFRHATSAALVACDSSALASEVLGIGYEVVGAFRWLIDSITGEEDESALHFVKATIMDLYNDFSGIDMSLCRDPTPRDAIASELANRTRGGAFLILEDGRLKRSGTKKDFLKELEERIETSIEKLLSPPEKTTRERSHETGSKEDVSDEEDEGDEGDDYVGPGEMIA